MANEKHRQFIFIEINNRQATKIHYTAIMVVYKHYGVYNTPATDYLQCNKFSFTHFMLLV